MICKYAGFTLIEVIFVFVMAALLAAMTLPYFYSGAMSQATPINRLTVSTNLNNAMEAIVSDYNTNNLFSVKNAATLTAFSSKVNAFSTNYASSCSTCTATATTTTVGALTTAVLVTVKSESNEKIYRVFTIQAN